MHTWTTRPDGVVVVDGGIPRLTGPNLARLQRVATRWVSLFSAASQKTGVPLSWLLGIVQIESGGDPTAESPKGAIGLFQIMPPWWRGHTKIEMTDPALNTQYGSEILALVKKTQAAAYPELGLPGVASAYNCGSDDAKNSPRKRDNVWGMCAATGYIDSVVAGNNSAILDLRLGHTETAPSSTVATASLVALAALGLGWLLRSR